MGMNQDGLLSMWLMSRRDEFFTRADALQMYFQAGIDARLPMPAILKPVELWTGKQIISAAFPDTISLVKGPERQEDEENNLYPADSAVIVIRGQLLAGQLSKRTVGVAGGSLQHCIATCSAYAGNEDARIKAISSFFDAVERIGREFMVNHSFSIGISDVGIMCDRTSLGLGACWQRNESTANMCSCCRQNVTNREKAEELVGNVAGLIRRATSAEAALKFVKDGGHPDIIHDSRISAIERKIISMQDRVRDEQGTATATLFAKRVYSRNAVDEMVSAGSKGTATSRTQMAVMVGGQMIGGARVIDYSVAHGPAPPPLELQPSGKPARNLTSRLLAWPQYRPLPHFLRMYPGACEGGFVMQSFVTGLDPIAFWNHDAASRQGLIDSALNTAKSGYLQRRMMKGQVDLMVKYDGTVRNCNGKLIEFNYGTNGKFVQPKVFQPATAWSHAEIGQRLMWQSPAYAALLAAFPVLERENKAVGDAVAKLKKLLLADRDKNGTLYTPGNVRLMMADLSDACARLRDVHWPDVLPDEPGIVSAWTAAALVEEFFESAAKRKLIAEETLGLEARVWTCSRQLVGQWRFDEANVREALHRLEWLFYQSKVEPGDAVGAIAAVSMGEPTTQMTLNSFHKAGTTAAKVGGVELCNELVLATSNQKTPMVRAYMSADLAAAAQKDFEEIMAMLVPFPTRALPTEEPALFREICNVCPPDGPVIDFVPVSAESCDFYTDILQLAEYDWHGLSCVISFHVYERFGLFYGHSLCIVGNRVTIERAKDFPLASLVPATAAEFLAKERGVPCKLRYGGFMGNNVDQRAMFAALQTYLVKLCPKLSDRDPERIRQQAQYRKLVPLRQRVRTTLLGSMVTETAIDWLPLEPMANSRGKMFLCPHNAAADDVDRWTFDDTSVLSVAPGTGQKRGIAVADPLADNVLPACANPETCPWRTLLHVRCLSGFVATLYLRSDALELLEITANTLEEELSTGPLAGSYIVHLGEHNPETGCRALRLRARLCRIYKNNTSLSVADMNALDETSDLEKMMQSLFGVRVSGPAGTTAATMLPAQTGTLTSDGCIAQRQEIVLDVATHDLRHVLSMPGIDQTRTTANTIHEIVQVMGVEAARAVLVRELEEMVASGSTYVDRHHIALMADTMMATGRYLGFSHDHMRYMRDEPIMLASYEEQAQTLILAGQNAASVPAISPATSICLGQRIPGLGTAAFELFLDAAMVEAEAMPVPDELEHIDTEEYYRKRASIKASPSRDDTHVFTPARQSLSPAASPNRVPFSPIASDRFVSFMEVAATAAASADEAWNASPSSPSFSAIYSPSGTIASPMYSPSMAMYSPSSPSFASISSPAYSPSSPSFASITSPAYSPSSPSFAAVTSPAYSPSSPSFTFPPEQPAEVIAEEMAELGLGDEDDDGLDSGGEDVDYAPVDVGDDFVYDPNAQW